LIFKHFGGNGMTLCLTAVKLWCFKLCAFFLCNTLYLWFSCWSE